MAEWTLMASVCLHFCAILHPVFFHIYFPVNAPYPVARICYPAIYLNCDCPG